MRFHVSASQQKTAAVKWVGVGLLVVLAALVFFLVATTANGFFLGDLGSFPGQRGGWSGDSLLLGQCLGGKAQSCAAISKFSLAYTLNSGLLIQVIGHVNKLPTFLAALNALALALPILLLRFSRASRDLFVSWGLYVLLWLLTPIPRFYLFTGSLEVQAGAVTGLAFVLTFRALMARDGEPKSTPPPSLITILLCNGLWFMSCLYKDTSVITFSLVGFLLFFADQAQRDLALQASFIGNHCTREEAIAAKALAKPPLLTNQLVRALWLTVPAFVAAILVAVSFNLVRYRSFLPEAYLNEARLTTTPIFFRLQSLFWTLASPNGGLVVFWGLCFAVLGLVWIRRGRYERVQFAAVKAASLWALISLIGLSLWWNPFGWASWGDRLMVPAMMAIVIAFWEALTSPRRLQPMPVHGAQGEAQFLSEPGSTEWKLRSKPALLASYLLVGILIMSSFPYVSLGYQGNGMDVRHHPAPELIHCAKMMARLQAVPEERHLQDVYSGEQWWQCALESYRHNPVLVW